MNHLEEISKLKTRIDRSWLPWWRRKLEERRTQIIREYLEENDQHFQRLITRQYELLKKDFKLKSSQSRNVMFGSHSTRFKGKIHDNGYAYLNVSGHNFITFNPFYGMRYPRAFKGRVDYLGKISLVADTFNYRLIRTLPEEFECKINDEGHLIAKTLRTSAELSQGIITKMIGCMISDNKGVLR